MRRRTLLTTGSFSIAALVLAACSNSQEKQNQAGPGWSIPSDDPTATIKVLIFGEASAMQATLGGFEEAHPTITVDVHAVPFDSLIATISKEVPAKDGSPDVYLVDATQTAPFTARGYTEDLTKQFAPYTSRWDKSLVENSTVDGKLNSLPMQTSTQLLYYNKDLLAKAGIPAPSSDPGSPLTWEQVSEYAKKAVNAGAANGLLIGQPDTYYQLEPLPVSLGGSSGGTGKGNLTPDVTSAAWVKAFTWYQSTFKDGITPMAMDAPSATFKAGQAAFMVNGQWSLTSANPGGAFNWGVAPMPYFEGGKPVTPTGSFNLAMNAFSKNKEAAAIFMKYITVDGGVTKLSGNLTDLTASKVDREQYFQLHPEWQSALGQEAQKIVNYQLENTSVNRLNSVGYIEFENILNKTFSDIRNGQDVKTALESASAQIKSAWSNYQ